MYKFTLTLCLVAIVFSYRVLVNRIGNLKNIKYILKCKKTMLTYMDGLVVGGRNFSLCEINRVLYCKMLTDRDSP